MMFIKAESPGGGDRGALGKTSAVLAERRLLPQNQPQKQAIIAAELIGSHECRCEEHERVTVGYAPVLGMCRELLAVGLSPDAALHVYRRGVLALKIRAIGAVARLCVEDNEVGRPQLRLARPSRREATMCTASPIRKNGKAAP